MTAVFCWFLVLVKRGETSTPSSQRWLFGSASWNIWTDWSCICMIWRQLRWWIRWCLCSRQRPWVHWHEFTRWWCDSKEVRYVQRWLLLMLRHLPRSGCPEAGLKTHRGYHRRRSRISKFSAQQSLILLPPRSPRTPPGRKDEFLFRTCSMHGTTDMRCGSGWHNPYDSAVTSGRTHGMRILHGSLLLCASNELCGIRLACGHLFWRRWLPAALHLPCTAGSRNPCGPPDFQLCVRLRLPAITQALGLIFWFWSLGVKKQQALVYQFYDTAYHILIMQEGSSQQKHRQLWLCVRFIVNALQRKTSTRRANDTVPRAYHSKLDGDAQAGGKSKWNRDVRSVNDRCQHRRGNVDGPSSFTATSINSVLSVSNPAPCMIPRNICWKTTLTSWASNWTIPPIWHSIILGDC